MGGHGAHEKIGEVLKKSDPGQRKDDLKKCPDGVPPQGSWTLPQWRDPGFVNWKRWKGLPV